MLSEKLQLMKKLLPVLIVLLNCCQKYETDISNIHDATKVIGHGGMGIAHTYPMNTYPSVRRALTLGADGVELDVQMTRDGVFVAYHDYELSDRSTASGQIFAQNWDDIKGATYLNPIYTAYPVMRLDSLISRLPGREDVIFFLDCKNFNPDTTDYFLDKFAGALLNFLNSYLPAKNTYVELKRTDLILRLQSKRDDVMIFYYGENFNDAIKTAIEYELAGITLAIHLISEDQVKQAHSEGLMVSVVNVHTRSRNRKAVRMNVDFIQTDMLRFLMSFLGR